MKILKRSRVVTFSLAGEPIDLRLFVPSHGESREFLAAMERAGEAATKGAGLQGMFPEQDVETLVTAFNKWVRPAEPMQTEDGRELSNGKDIFEAMSTGVVMDVLEQLMAMATETSKKGKASASPSTSSSVAPALPSSGSDAKPIVPEGGATP